MSDSCSTSPRLPASRAKLPCIGASAFLLAAALTACGGGDNQPTATVTSASVAAARYGATALLTIAGTDLGNITVTSSGCKNIQRLTTPPSTPTTAYYGCTVSGAFSSNFVISSNGSVVGTSNTFTVPIPQVTMAVTDGAGINGNIVISLAGDKMPITVDNFLAYVNAGFYSGQIFDRVVRGFVAQGGLYGAAPNGILGNPKATNPPIPLETNPAMHNTPWTIAMARGNDPASATAEFYINLIDNSGILDGNYAVFGTLSADSVAIMQEIAAAPAQCVNNPLARTIDCLPIPNITIASATQTQ